jgi:hypothetical protein
MTPLPLLFHRRYRIKIIEEVISPSGFDADDPDAK